MATAQDTFRMILTAEDRASSVLGKVGGSLTGLTGQLAGLVSAAGLFAFGKQVIDLAGHLTDLSAQTGISAQTLSGLKSTLEENGTSIDAFAKGIFTAQKNIGGASSETQKAIKDLGLDFQQLATATPEEFLKTVAGALAQIPNPTERASLGAALLGRAFKELSPALSEISGKFEELRAKGVKAEDIAKLDKLGDSITSLKNKVLLFALDKLAQGSDIIAALAAKVGLLGPEAQKLAEAESRLGAIEQERIRINEQLRTSEDLRAKGLRSGLASDGIYNALVKKGNDLLAERNRLQEFVGPTQQAKAVVPGSDPAAIATTQKITSALNVIQERAIELVKSGLKPSTEEMERMLTTVRLAEIQGYKTFGLMFPDNLNKTFAETNKVVKELARLSDIDTTEIDKKLPKALKDSTSMGGDVQRIFDPIKNAWAIVNKQADDASDKSRDVADEMYGWNSRLKDFEAETAKADLPTTLEGWKKGAEGFGVAINTVTGAQAGYNLQLKESIRLTDELNRKRGSGSVGGSSANLEDALKRDKLTSNEPEY